MFLIPYNFFEDFFIMVNIANSLRQEANSRPKLKGFGDFGMASGLGWATAQVISLIPNTIGQIAGVVALILWVGHWIVMVQI
jgi:hypothetical protein